METQEQLTDSRVKDIDAIKGNGAEQPKPRCSFNDLLSGTPRNFRTLERRFNFVLASESRSDEYKASVREAYARLNCLVGPERYRRCDAHPVKT